MIYRFKKKEKRKIHENNNDNMAENDKIYYYVLWCSWWMLFASLWSTSDRRKVLGRLIYERFNAWEDASPLGKAKRLDGCYRNKVEDGKSPRHISYATNHDLLRCPNHTTILQCCTWTGATVSTGGGPAQAPVFCAFGFVSFTSLRSTAAHLDTWCVVALPSSSSSFIQQIIVAN